MRQLQYQLVSSDSKMSDSKQTLNIALTFLCLYCCILIVGIFVHMLRSLWKMQHESRPKDSDESEVHTDLDSLVTITTSQTDECFV